MRANRSRHGRRALRRLKIRPPVEPLGGERPGRTRARLRHEQTNYDALLDAFRFKAHEHKMFKWAVTQRILEALEE